MSSHSDSRRAVLRKAYKETPKKMGAYCIQNTQNQKRFVGVSRDVEARLNRHRFMLKTGSERELLELADEWANGDPDQFEFSILELLEPPADVQNYDPTEDLEVLLEVWMEQLQPYVPLGYHAPVS